MLLEFEAILGQRSAHSFATGPVIADPFISPLLLTITPALSSKYMNTPSFLLKGFRCRITTACITRVEIGNMWVNLTSTSYFRLNSAHLNTSKIIQKQSVLVITFFSQLWLSFLNCGNKHVTNSSSRHTVKTTLDTVNSNDIQVLGSWIMK